MTREQYEVWRAQPETVEIFELLNATVVDLAAVIADGNTLNTESCEATAIKTAMVVGRINGIKEILDISFED